MKILRCDQVHVPSRFRKEFPTPAEEKLRRSIAEVGLLHPIIVREVGNSFELVAGERRLRVLSSWKNDTYLFDKVELRKGLVPTVSLGEVLDPIALTAQAHENLARLDFSWQERAEAYAALHHIRREETDGLQPKSRTVGEIIRSRPANQADVAELTASLLVVDHFDDPEVAQAKTLREAEALIARKKRIEHDAAIAAMVKTVPTPHRLHHGRAEDTLPLLDAEEFDVIIADPLYGINAHTHASVSDSEAAYTHPYNDSLENALRLWQTIAAEGFRIAKPKAHLYIFHDFSRWPLLSTIVEAVGWTLWPRPIIWDKGVGGMIGDYRHGPARAYESILYAVKGNKEVTGVFQEVIRLPSAADTALNAAAKPFSLYIDLLRRSARPGDRVIDPCCGTGPIFPAATWLSLYATGIEPDQNLYHSCLPRMNEKPFSPTSSSL